MTFDDVLAQVLALLQREGRVAYRALKRRFELDDEYVEDLKSELIDAKRVAQDEDGKVLVWIGEEGNGEEGTSSRQPSATSREAQQAERRQLTVMFCDMVGSTALSEQLDPEELRELLHAYQETSAAAISRFDGYIAQYLGDGLLVYFGYPTAHEEDPQRAVRAGLGIIEELKHLNAQIQVPIQVRIGIHTGQVVVGEIGGGNRHERLALGETPNIAARIQGQAEPDTVFISAATYRLVQGFFEYRERDAQRLKGISTPLVMYQVLGESEVRSRFEAVIRTGLTPLVGREEEVGLLQKCWESVKAGEGQAVLLSGEAGIGKSRLVQVLKGQIDLDGRAQLSLQCSPYYQNSALFPVIEHLQRLVQFEREDTLQEKSEKLVQTLSQYRFPQADTPPLLAALLSLPHPEGYPPISLSPQMQKQKTQEALVAWLMEEAEKTTLYFAWEDLHWADPSSLELLQLCLDQLPTAQMLLLLTFRPEFQPPWDSRSCISQLILSRFERPQVEEMIDKISEGKALPGEVVQQIVAKTDGVPLFVEELTKMVVESGLLKEVNGHFELAGPLPSLAIPATLQDSLMARLDRFVLVREIAQLGAALGREFGYELIQAVSPLDEATLQQGLKRLVDAELIYQRGFLPQANYIFKHALVQDTAYQSLLKSKRQQLHQQVAQVLEERFPETKETQPEVVAHHYTEGGETEKAVVYWQRAGQRAYARSAHIEATRHLTKGLELLQILPETPARDQQELTLQISLGTALMATKGYAAPAAEAAFAQARELCQQLEETPQLFPVLLGLSSFYIARAELHIARELGEQLLRLAQSLQDSELLLPAHVSLGASLFYRGELVAAQAHLEQGFALYDSHQHRSLAFRYGNDPGVAFLSFGASTLWLLGYPDQALKRSQEALALAQEVSHPFSLAAALKFSARIHQFRREAQAMRERAETSISLSTEQGFAYWLAQSTILRGWALTKQGQEEEGLAQMHQGLAAWRSIGSELWQLYFLALLAEVYGRVGQAEEGLLLLAEALVTLPNREERFYEAELYRLKGELLLARESKRRKSQGEKEKALEVERSFQKAIEVARCQSAKSLELRAVMSLSRLWHRQGRKEEARQMLAEIYGWFTEGFDTADLQEAKALLEAVS